MTRRFLALLLSVLLLLCVTGCGNDAASARDAVQKFEAEMNENNYKAAFAYVADYDGFGFDKDTERIINAVSSSLRINVINDTSTATNAVLEVDITTIDLREVYCNAAAIVIPQYYSAALAGEDISAADISLKMMQEVVGISEGPSAPTITTRIPLTVGLNNDSEWVIRLDVAAYNAITGYLDEANNLITTGTIVQAINGETDFLSGSITQPEQPEVSGGDVSGSDASPSDVQ